MHRWVQKTCEMNSMHVHMQRILSAPAQCACGMPPEHLAWAPFPRHAGQSLQAHPHDVKHSGAPTTNEMSATGGARLARRAKPPLQDSVGCPEGSPAGKRRRTPETHPGHHQGSPHRIATKTQQTARIQNGDCLGIIPKGRPDTGAQASPSATPQTPEPPAHTTASERERERDKRSAGCGATKMC